MPDKYNSKIAWLVGKLNGAKHGYAVTVSQSCTLYSVPEKLVTTRWRKHEDCHKRQYAAHGSRISFWWAYLKESIKHGYNNNAFEIEARTAANNE